MSNKMKKDTILCAICSLVSLFVLVFWAIPNFNKGMGTARQLAEVNGPALSNWPWYGILGLILIFTLPSLIAASSCVVVKRALNLIKNNEES